MSSNPSPKHDHFCNYASCASPHPLPLSSHALIPQLEVKIEGLPLKRHARQARVIHAPFNEVGSGEVKGGGVGIGAGRGGDVVLRRASMRRCIHMQRGW